MSIYGGMVYYLQKTLAWHIEKHFTVKDGKELN